MQGFLRSAGQVPRADPRLLMSPCRTVLQAGLASIAGPGGGHSKVIGMGMEEVAVPSRVAGKRIWEGSRRGRSVYERCKLECQAGMSLTCSFCHRCTLLKYSIGWYLKGIRALGPAPGSMDPPRACSLCFPPLPLQLPTPAVAGPCTCASGPLPAPVAPDPLQRGRETHSVTARATRSRVHEQGRIRDVFQWGGTPQGFPPLDQTHS